MLYSFWYQGGGEEFLAFACSLLPRSLADRGIGDGQSALQACSPVIPMLDVNNLTVGYLTLDVPMWLKKDFFFVVRKIPSLTKQKGQTHKFRQCCKAVVDYSLTELERNPREAGCRQQIWELNESIAACVLLLRNLSYIFCYTVGICFKLHAVLTWEEKCL